MHKSPLSYLLLITLLSFASTLYAQDSRNTRSYPVNILAETFGYGQSEVDVKLNTIFQGCASRDCIPSVDEPKFIPADAVDYLEDSDLLLSLEFGGEARAYPVRFLDRHEIVNDGPSSDPFTTSYCPLTGSAVAWKANPVYNDPEFGTSGLLYNSNLILYDRQTSSLWAQMRQESINGRRVRESPEQIQVIETSWATWSSMYPDSLVMTEITGADRNYNAYPYGSYRTNTGLLFPVNNVDTRLHPKTRVVGISEGGASKVFQIAGFGATTVAINEQFGTKQIVVVGNTAANFAAIYDRTMSDGTVLNFTALDGQLPNVLQDDEGNVWDAFGEAVSGPRAGEKLAGTTSYIALWFAWVAFFPQSEIHFN